MSRSTLVDTVALTCEFAWNLSNRLKVNEFAALTTSVFVSRVTGF